MRKQRPQMTQMNADNQTAGNHLRKSAPSADKEKANNE
jgi:hypothetical protein